jgi:UMP-CMP kinase
MAAEGKLDLPENNQLSGKETAIIKSVLASNSLLADEDFPIAEKLLTAFIEKRKVEPADVVILNGLPRHKNQAIALEKIVDIRVVIILSSTADTIYERISTNSGGDREGRIDDSVEEIEKKIKTYIEKTLPLVEHYKSLDRNILEIEVDLETIPLYIIQALETMPSLI